MKSLKFFLIFIFAPLLALEFWVRNSLFEYVSYSKSASLDSTLSDLSSFRQNDIYFFGDSEVRWGINPIYFDEKFRQSGSDIQSFNFGMDGFSSGLNLSMLKNIGVRDFKGIKVALVGVQLIEYNQTFESSEQIRNLVGNGALQRPVFLSSYGVDKNLTTWASDSANYLDKVPLTLIKYRSSIKELFTSKKQRVKNITTKGFQPHVSIAANEKNFSDEIKSKAEEKAGSPKNFEPLDIGFWGKSLENGSYFDQYSQFFLNNDVIPVFFALPTNPWLIDYKNRRDSYLANSAALESWAKGKGLIFVDVGILDEFSPTLDFADFRHLSFRGAAKFSDLLAVKLIQNQKFLSFLHSSVSDRRELAKQISSKCDIEFYSPARIQREFISDNDISEMIDMKDFLLVKASGTDSRLILSDIKKSLGKNLRLEFSIETNFDTTFTVSWTTETNKSFSNSMTTEYTLRNGMNNFSLLIDADSNITGVRVDPGQLSGEYKIYSISSSQKCQ